MHRPGRRSAKNPTSCERRRPRSGYELSLTRPARGRRPRLLGCPVKCIQGPPQRPRSSACTSSRRHGYRLSWRLVGQPRLWQPGRVTCSSPTGWGPTTDELRTSGSATDYRRPSRASDLESSEDIAMVLCRWSPTPPQREPDQREASQPRRPPQLSGAKQRARPAKVLCRSDLWVGPRIESVELSRCGAVAWRT
jgi:hypothetical protein